MNSESLSDTSWKMYAIGILMLILANIYEADSGKLAFALLGLFNIVTALAFTIISIVREKREFETKRKMAERLIESMIDEQKKNTPAKRQKRTRSVKETKTVKDTSKKPNKA